jgi:Rrf2 family transcriptional regulator, iron-sulfur cluster assembly transcription factor
MCIFLKGRNAVIAVLDLALHEKHGPVSLPGICERTGMTLSYLESIFRKLRNNGIVLTIRGSQGGFLLARPVDEVTVAQILLAMNDVLQKTPEVQMRQSGGRRRSSAYTADGLWSTLNDQLMAYLQTMSIKELIERHAASRYEV